MSRRVKLLDLNKIKNSLTTAVRAYMVEEFLPEQVVPEIEELIRELFERTTHGWEGGAGALGLGGSDKTYVEPAPPELHFDVDYTKFGANITAYVDSYIWNLLDQGRDDRITEKKEVFVAREDQRTVPGTLDVSSNRTYTDIVHVAKGTLIKGIRPRRWTEIISEEVEQQLGAKYPNIKFSFTVKEQDIGR